MKKYCTVFVASLVLSGVFAPVSLHAQAEATSTASTTSLTVPTLATSTSTTTPSIKPVHNAQEIEARIREYFKDVPVMTEIARCESKFRQYTDGGNVFMGGYGGGMVGIFQIYRDVHKNAAQALGIDINTVEGNLAYARHLHTQSGTGPWVSSMPCWNTNPVPEQVATTQTETSTVQGTLTTNLIFGMEHPQVLLLQKILNNAGFLIASSGPGSAGNETSKFGALTRTAVRAFQCKQNIVCSGDEYTTAFGLVGPRTRNALLQNAGSITTLSTNTQSPTPVQIQVQTSVQTQSTEVQSKIAELQKQIANLQKQLAELQKQLSQ